MNNILTAIIGRVPVIRRIYRNRNHLPAERNEIVHEQNRSIVEQNRDTFSRKLIERYYQDEEFIVNCFGIKLRRSIIPKWTHYYEKNAYPQVDENYLEYIDVLTAVDEADTEFTMVELGAGFGRWLVTAELALRKRGAIPSRLIGVEPEPRHYHWMLEHFRDNGIDPDKHILIHAAVTDGTQEEVFFRTDLPDEWGESVMLEVGVDAQNHSYDKVSAITLSDLIQEYPLIDLVDMDVQGMELRVLQESIKVVRNKVKLLHIGTHSREIEDGLRQLLSSNNLINKNDYPCHSTCMTQYGSVDFCDGVQTWVNPKFMSHISS